MENFRLLLDQENRFRKTESSTRWFWQKSNQDKTNIALGWIDYSLQKSFLYFDPWNCFQWKILIVTIFLTLKLILRIYKVYQFMDTKRKVVCLEYVKNWKHWSRITVISEWSLESGIVHYFVYAYLWLQMKSNCQTTK